MSLYGRPSDYAHRLPNQPAIDRFANAVWAVAVGGSRPSIRLSPRKATRKFGTWRVRMHEGKPLESILLNGPHGLQAATILHELAHSMHFRQCGSLAEWRRQDHHGHQWLACLRELEVAADLVWEEEAKRALAGLSRVVTALAADRTGR